MKLAIGHYHLNRGGVTRVIENQLLALDSVLGNGEICETLVFYGGRREGWPSDLPDRLQNIRLRLEPLPELDYDSEQANEPGNLVSRLLGKLEQAGFSPDHTVVHLHNHSIGKNAALPPTVWKLAERGFGLLLQIHDFAEDQRPDNFRLLAEAGKNLPDWHGRLYPQAPNVHFAVLNGRDRNVLQSVGIPPGQLHFLPNPVLSFQRFPEREAARAKLNNLFTVSPDERFLLYPVRGIRRKNVGEALLYSVLLPAGTVVGLTLPPLNPTERVRYEHWKATAQRCRPPFRFDVGAPGGLSFGENLAASDAILTTSVAEGFGMVYLESWLADRPLSGRNLPEITHDFSEAGLNLSRLRSRLEVPTDWIDTAQLRESLLNGFRATIEAYGRSQPPELVEQVAEKIGGNTIDFGDLDETFQAAILQKVISEPSARQDVLDANPGIVDVDNRELVQTNASVVHREFSLQPSGARLAAVYDTVANSARNHEIGPLDHPGAILDRFLDFSRFRLLRSYVCRDRGENGRNAE